MSLAPVRPPNLVLDDLSAAHGRVAAISGISGCFEPGSLTAIVGPNGAGKTTLLRCIAGLHTPTAGRIERGGLAPHRIALLPQGSAIDRGFPISCREFAALGGWHRGGPWRRLPEADATAALGEVGLGDHQIPDRPISDLSAGQFQRLLFARMIVQDAPVLLLDEPFNAVDAGTEATLLALLRMWHGQGRTIVAVLHNLDLVTHVFPRTLLLARRVIAWGPTSEALSAANRARARTTADAWGSRAALPARDVA